MKVKWVCLFYLFVAVPFETGSGFVIEVGFELTILSPPEHATMTSMCHRPVF